MGSILQYLFPPPKRERAIATQKMIVKMIRSIQVRNKLGNHMG